MAEDKSSKIEDAIILSEDQSDSNLHFGELIGIMLDYYSSTGEQPLTEGNEWKRNSPDYMPKGIEIPDTINKEVEKAFIAQVKKFHK